jgi:hypothetical protein
MIDKLLASPVALIAFILIVCAAIGFVVLRRPSVNINRSLWAALAAGIALMLYAAFRPEPPPPPKELLTGSILRRCRRAFPELHEVPGHNAVRRRG